MVWFKFGGLGALNLSSLYYRNIPFNQLIILISAFLASFRSFFLPSHSSL